MLILHTDNITPIQKLDILHIFMFFHVYEEINKLTCFFNITQNSHFVPFK